MQPSLQDVVKPFDPTGFATLSGAGIAQLADGIAPYTDKGLVVVTTDIATVPQVPDAITNTKWKNYIWVRRQPTAVITYVWNEGGANDPTYQNWASLTLTSLADGAVTNSKLAENSVTNDKIYSVDWSKLTSIPTGLMIGGVTAAGGDLTGTYPNPTIAANAVTSTKLASDASVDANRAVGTDHIKDASVTPAKLSAVAVAGFMPIGTILPFSASTIPANYLACDGSPISRATYTALFALFNADSLKWGIGNGTTTFNLPDLRGFFLRGWSVDASVDPDGARLPGEGPNGSATPGGKFQADKVKAHTHDVTIAVDTPSGTDDALMPQSDSGTNHVYTSTNQNPAGATETRPLNKAVIFIIKVL